MILAYVGLTLAEGIVAFCDEYLSDWVGGRFIVSLADAVLRPPAGPLAGVLRPPASGDVMSRVTDDVEEIEDLMLSG